MLMNDPGMIVEVGLRPLALIAPVFTSPIATIWGLIVKVEGVKGSTFMDELMFNVT